MALGALPAPVLNVPSPDAEQALCAGEQTIWVRAPLEPTLNAAMLPTPAAVVEFWPAM
jgi:hypothetical protein